MDNNKKQHVFDTSKEEWERIGIHVTEKQYRELVDINLLMMREGDPTPVHHILLILKTLGLLPKEAAEDTQEPDFTELTLDERIKAIEDKYGRMIPYN